MATPALRETECTLIAYSGCFPHSRFFVGFLTLGGIGSIGIGELLRGRGIGSVLYVRVRSWLLVSVILGGHLSGSMLPVTIQDYTFLRLIGKGGFFSLYLVQSERVQRLPAPREDVANAEVAQQRDA
jgi:hypothetical protein